jgi:hypothetical protein
MKLNLGGWLILIIMAWAVWVTHAPPTKDGSTKTMALLREVWRSI